MAATGFIGLGVIGSRMAGHLFTKVTEEKHQLTIYNRTPSKSELWFKTYCHNELDNSPNHYPDANPQPKAIFDKNNLPQLAQENEIIITCVGNDQDLETLAEQLIPHLSPNAIWIDHTTASASIAEQLSGRLSAQRCHFIDAPVSGGQEGAEKGTLSVMCGGHESVIKQVTPILNLYAGKIVRIGPNGHGQIAKMANQIAVAGLIQALSESLQFIVNSGVDVEKVMSIISQGAASSWQMQNRYQAMLSGHFDHGFAINWMKKDLGICLEAAKSFNTELPITQIVHEYYQELITQGDGQLDTSALIKRLR